LTSVKAGSLAVRNAKVDFLNLQVDSHADLDRRAASQNVRAVFHAARNERVASPSVKAGSRGGRNAKVDFQNLQVDSRGVQNEREPAQGVRSVKVGLRNLPADSAVGLSVPVDLAKGLAKIVARGVAAVSQGD